VEEGERFRFVLVRFGGSWGPTEDMVVV
jgi:hypothetical protein